MIKEYIKGKLILYVLPIVIILVLALWIINAITIIFVGQSVTDEECKQNQSAVSINVDSKTQEENAKVIYQFLLKNYQATPQGASGVLGNFEQESGINPKSIERQNDPLSGHGIAQWTADRTTLLMNFAKEKGKEWDNLGLQIELLDKELKGSEKNSVQALKATSVDEATIQWQALYERAGTPVLGNRLLFATKWYAKLGSSDPISENTINGAVEGGFEDYNDTCSIESSGNSDSNILESAKKYIGWFHYPNPIAHNLQMIGGDPRKPNKEGETDCSGFIWLALENAGYKVPPNMGWFTGSMTADARGSHEWLNSISDSEAEAGDVVIVNVGQGSGSNGHTAIIAEKWHGNDTKIIQMGGNDSITNESTFGNSFSSLLGSGDICFARPIKK